MQRANGLPAQDARLRTRRMHVCVQGCTYAGERRLHASILFMLAAEDAARVRAEATFLLHTATFPLEARGADSREKQPSVQDAFAALIRSC